MQLLDQPRWDELVRLREQFQKPVVIDENRYEGDAPTDWGSLPPEELVHRFWIAAVAGAYNGHSETYIKGERPIWWSHGGRLHGESWQRIRFLRSIVESGPPIGLTPIGLRTSPWRADKGDEFVVAYFGVHAPSGWTARLPRGRRFVIELLDTWRMTRRRLPGTWADGELVPLPRRSYLALRATAAP